MRRRVHEGQSTDPIHLRRYDPADWPNPECHPECAFWAAVEQWRDEHPGDENGVLEILYGPDVPWHPEWI